MNFKNFLTALCAAGVAAMLLFQSAELSEGVRKGLYACSYYIIPAVFPFMVLSAFICKSKAGEFFSYALRPATAFLRLPKTAGKALLAAIIGGYPTGAKCINDLVLHGEIDRKTAARMLTFCVNAGPPFLICAVGAGIFGNIKTGLLIFAAQMLSAFIIAAAGAAFAKKPRQNAEGVLASEGSAAAVFTESVISSAESCFKMCAFIVLAFGGLEILQKGATFGKIGGNSVFAAFFAGFFEVTAGCIASGETGGFAAIAAAGAIASFSGISVILQVAAVTEESRISLLPFIFSRFVNGGITALLLTVFLSFSRETAETFSVKGSDIEMLLSVSAPAAVSLLCMASLFLLSIVPPKSEKEPIFSRILNKFNKKFIVK